MKKHLLSLIVLLLAGIVACHDGDGVATHGRASLSFFQPPLIYLSQENQVHLIDISQPDTPQLQDQITLPGEVQQVALNNRFAYVTHLPNSYTVRPEGQYDGGMLIVGVEDPTAVWGSGYYIDGNIAQAIALTGTIAYLGQGGTTGQITIVDVAQHDQPQRIGQIDQPTDQLLIHGRYLYTSNGWCNTRSGCRGTLTIYDIADPTQPQHLSQTINAPNAETPQNPIYNLYLDETRQRLYAAGQGVAVFDVSDPTAPQWLAHEPLPQGWYNGVVTAVDDLVYTAADGVLMVLRATETGIEPITTINHPDLYAQAIAWHADKLYLDTATGLTIMDVSDPTQPVLHSFYSPTGNAAPLSPPGATAVP